MEKYYVEANGLRHAIRQYSFSGEPMILLHYLGGFTSIWDAFASHLSDKYQIIAIDLRGHGESDQPDSGYHLEDFSKDTEGILNVIGIEKAHFVGSSFGCDVALKFAVLNPGRVLTLSMSEGAMVNSSGPLGLHADSKEEFFNKYFSKPDPTFDSREDYIRFAKKAWQPWNEAKEACCHQEPLYRLNDNRFLPSIKQATIRQITGHLFDERLELYYEHTQCPVLFLPAENETGLKKKLAFIDHVKPLIKQSDVHIFPNSTHTMMLDVPEEMAEVVHRFIETNFS